MGRDAVCGVRRCVRGAEQLPAGAGRLQRRAAVSGCGAQPFAGARTAGAQYAQRLPENSIPALHPAAAAAENHRRADHGHRLAERRIYGKRGVPGLCAGTGHGHEPPPHGVSRRRYGSAAHDVRCEYVYERDGVSAAVAVAGVFFPAGDAGRAEGPRGLVRGGGGVLLPAVSEQGGRALLSDRLGACACVGLVA